MPIPPLNFIEPRDAVRRVRDAFGCTEEAAVHFLCDRWIDGVLVPRFLGSTPPDAVKHDTSLIDWFSGALVRTFHLQRCAITRPGQRPEYDAYTDRYAFRIDRRQLDAVVAEAVAAVTGPHPPAVENSGRKPQPTTEAADDRQASQSEKAKLRRRVKEFLEAEAKIDPPRAETKGGWRQLAREKFGEVATSNLFDEGWQEAELPTIWRKPGRRT